MSRTFRDVAGGHAHRYLETGDGVMHTGILGHRFAKEWQKNQLRSAAKAAISAGLEDWLDEMESQTEYAALLAEEAEYIAIQEEAEYQDYLSDLEAEERYIQTMEEESQRLLDSLYDDPYWDYY